MAQAHNTNSTLTFPGGANKTSTAISTNILITVRSANGVGIPVGAIQSLNITESRAIARINEIGTDGNIDSLPHQSSEFSGTCSRIRFDRLRGTEAFSRGFLHIQSQAYPFDIVIFDRQKLNTGSQITTVLRNVWFSNIQYNYQATDWLIIDTMQLVWETMFSVLSNGNSTPAAQGGEIGIPFSSIPIERATDVGANGRRGSLDSPGLIDLGSSGTLF